VARRDRPSGRMLRPWLMPWQCLDQPRRKLPSGMGAREAAKLDQSILEIGAGDRFEAHLTFLACGGVSAYMPTITLGLPHLNLQALRCCDPTAEDSGATGPQARRRRPVRSWQPRLRSVVVEVAPNVRLVAETKVKGLNSSARPPQAWPRQCASVVSSNCLQVT
jgi:hypothetical protein